MAKRRARFRRNAGVGEFDLESGGGGQYIGIPRVAADFIRRVLVKNQTVQEAADALGLSMPNARQLVIQYKLQEKAGWSKALRESWLRYVTLGGAEAAFMAKLRRSKTGDMADVEGDESRWQ